VEFLVNIMQSPWYLFIVIFYVMPISGGMIMSKDKTLGMPDRIAGIYCIIIQVPWFVFILLEKFKP
jgi:hypothetical membrane protein